MLNKQKSNVPLIHFLSQCQATEYVVGRKGLAPRREKTEYENPLTCSIIAPAPFSSPNLKIVPSTGLTCRK